MKCNLKYLIQDEKGSLMPFWAIVGMMVVISIFWVENTSFSIMTKVREMNLTGLVTRASMTEQGNITDNIRKLVEASGDNGLQGSHTFSTHFRESTLEDLKQLQNNKRISELLATNLNANNNVAVPFEEINKTVGASPDIRFSTEDNSVKVFRPLNVIIAVEGSQKNRNNLARSKEALINSLTRLYNAAPTTRSSVIPYSYRINSNGRCYTGIERSDSFSFAWWDSFLSEEDYLDTLKSRLSYAKNSLSSAKSSISWQRSQVRSLQQERQKYSLGSAKYRELTSSIEYYKRTANKTELQLPTLEDNVNRAQDSFDSQNNYVQSLKLNPQYIYYLPLAKHYAKKYSNYQLLENYDDKFSNDGIFSITQGDFLRSANSISRSPAALSSLAVQRNRHFGDNETCPSSLVKYNLTSSSSVNNILSGIDFSGTKIMSLEGLIWAGRTAFTSSSSLTRNVILLFASDIDDVIGPDELIGVRQSCDVIKSSFINNKATKLIIVTENEDGESKFKEMNCATQWFEDTGYIVLDDIETDFSKTLEEKFNYVFSQESTTRNIQ